MDFIDELDALAPDDAGGRSTLFYRALRADWRALFAELRARRPILTLPSFLVVTRWVDVVDALSRPGTFHVPYQPHMDPSVGLFMLGRDDAKVNWRDKSVMRALLRWDDLPGIRALAAEVASEALAESGHEGTINVVSVSRLVPLRVVQQSFGFSGPDDATMLRWSRATQADMFHNLGNDPKLHANCVQAGTEMRAWVRSFLASRQPWASASGEDTVSRLLRMTGVGLSGLDAEGVVSNVCGLLVGAIETTSQAIVNATEQILLQPGVLEQARAAAASADPAALDPIVWEALRFNPMTTFVVRVATEPALLGLGTPYETRITPGRTVAIGIGSAMFDAGVLTDPDAFRARPRRQYLHTGFGPHECLGQFVAYAIIPETIRQLLLLPGLRLLPNGQSAVDNAGGPFAEHFLLGAGREAGYA